jgi:putative transposase
MSCYSRSFEAVLRRPVELGQYTSVSFGQRCDKMGVRPSMGSVGDAYDNAMDESFFASLECELLDRRSFQSKTEARLALFRYIEGWYNPRRRHSALGYQSPANFERNPTPTPNPKPALSTAPPASGLLRAGGGAVDNTTSQPTNA